MASSLLADWSLSASLGCSTVISDSLCPHSQLLLQACPSHSLLPSQERRSALPLVPAESLGGVLSHATAFIHADFPLALPSEYTQPLLPTSTAMTLVQATTICPLCYFNSFLASLPAPSHSCALKFILNPENGGSLLKHTSLLSLLCSESFSGFSSH